MKYCAIIIILTVGFVCNVEGLPVERTKVITSLGQRSNTYIKLDDAKGVTIGEQSIGCLVCEFVVAEFISQLESNKTSSEFLPWLEKKICSLLPPETGMNKIKTASIACEKIVDVVLKEIVRFIDEKIQPAAVCLQLKICSSYITQSYSVSSPRLLIYHYIPIIELKKMSFCQNKDKKPWGWN